MTIFHQIKAVKDVLCLFGLLYTSKITLQTLLTLYQGFKTFILPCFWKRNFIQEYGAWAVVTGCTRGIGLCYAHELAIRGMNLILIGRNVTKLKEIASDIKAEYYEVEIEVIEADFADNDDIKKTIEDGLAGKDIGVLVNNVGVILPHPMYFHEVYEGQFAQMIQVNINAATMMTQMVLPLMEKKKKGAIVNLASVSGLSPQPLQTVYAATKAYMDFFSRGLQIEYESSGITVQTLCPSYICTSMTAFSDNLSQPSFFVPSPDSFAASAIRTLGFSSYTTGYWTHSLQILFPFAFLPRLIYKLNKGFRSEALAK